MSGALNVVTTALTELAGLPAPLVLGGMVFTGSEVPSGIRVGGAQKVILHRLPGGRRLYDVIGPDEDAIEWTGILVGPLASAKAELLTAMRRDGLVRTLSFGDLVLQALIVKFEYCYQAQGTIIPYCLRAEIVTNFSLDPLVSGSGYSSAADVAVASTAVSIAQAVMGNTTSSYGAALAQTVGPVSAQLGGIANQLGSVTGMAPSNAGASLWAARTGIETCLASPLTSPTALSSVATPQQFGLMMAGASVSAYAAQARSSIARAQTMVPT